VFYTYMAALQDWARFSKRKGTPLESPVVG
jgi:hypothetical protein